MARTAALLLALLALVLPAAAQAADAHTRAGVAKQDATWHVGASGGQYSEDTPPVGGSAGIDPYTHSTKKRISDGVGLRTSVRALVVKDTQGDRVAIVSHDLYLPQDFLTRRVAGILMERDRKIELGLAKGAPTGITEDTLAVTASHNHNTPYYSTPGWGTAIFQDVIDLRFYEYMANQMARAVVKATSTMKPVRMGGMTRTFDAIQSHTYGPQIGDDGAPAGQPYSHTTRQVSVLRFDDISGKKPVPMANWVVFGVHPEYTWGYDLISGDITQAAARIVDREMGTLSVFTQRETGASGPHKDQRVHAGSLRREFQENGFSGLDRAARLLADAIEDAMRDIAAGRPERTNAFQPFTSTFDVATVSQRFAPPATRPYPGVSNCNTASLFHGDPRVPILGLPDCAKTNEYGTEPLTSQLKPITSPLYDQLKEAGVPVPESYSATALTAVEETTAVHLMAIRLGDTVATICPCELFTDTALNIESRLDRVAGNFYEGFDWAEQKTPSGRDWCVPGAPGTWTCANPKTPGKDLPPISDRAYKTFRAQIHNDAAGWEEDLSTLGSEAEPADPTKIKGNFTHEELTKHGYGLVLAVGMGNDYWGYMPEYREYRSHDHYRKALTALGPHGADFLATRLTRMAAGLNGGEGVALSPRDMAMAAESARAFATAYGLGGLARAYTAAYEKTLPAEGGTPAIVSQPKDITRFAAAHVQWVGGSNYTDLPDVRVERRQGKRWVRFGDTTGDLPLMVDFPKPEQLGDWRTGSFEWKWTASFEAFGSDIAQPDARGKTRDLTPAGTYRFVVRGKRRAEHGGAAKAYTLASEPFTVSPWRGLRAEALRVEDDGTVSFAAPVDYPDSYASPFRFIDPERKVLTFGTPDPSDDQAYCPKCSFRPWADTGTVERAEVTFAEGGRTRTVKARRGADGRWRTVATLPAGGKAYVAEGDLQDGFGQTNDTQSPEVTR
jgi:hypothetical protein